MKCVSLSSIPPLPQTFSDFISILQTLSPFQSLVHGPPCTAKDIVEGKTVQVFLPVSASNPPCTELKNLLATTNLSTESTCCYSNLCAQPPPITCKLGGSAPGFSTVDIRTDHATNLFQYVEMLMLICRRLLNPLI